MLVDPRRNPKLASALRLLAPGTDLRLGINDIIKGHLGALIVIAEREEIEPLCSGGLALNIPFSSQMLYEVAKMDGAIVVDDELSTILRANVHLMPDAAMPTAETGTRHRTAERVARQTDAIVVAISQERDTVNVYTGGSRYQLDSISELLAKATQGLATLQGHRAQLDRGADELTTQELRGEVSIDDVLNVLQRSEMAARMIGEIERNATELGSMAASSRCNSSSCPRGWRRSASRSSATTAAPTRPRTPTSCSSTSPPCATASSSTSTAWRGRLDSPIAPPPTCVPVATAR
jgi:diadenylate cyclase